ncbi:hypothetical protein K501DRAFT_274588 [Backusella circina FSU 941]|nr:hypothetical protein K501DRAFT_274588 [Backusella circina FSU 941]
MSFLIFTLGLIPASITIFLYKAYNGTYKKFQQVQSNTFANTPEIHDPVSLNSVCGSIPNWLNGIMYRIGPGMFQIERDDGSVFSIQHTFDGLPFMHRLEISGKNQSVKYNSRLLAKSLTSDIKQRKDDILIFFGHVLKLSFFEWAKRIVTRINQVVIHPIEPSSKKPDGGLVGVTASPNFPLPPRFNKPAEKENVLIAKTDANYLQKINSETLVPEALFSYADYDSTLTDQLSAAHHQFDPKTGETFNFTLTFAPFPRLRVFSISNTGKTVILADITHRKSKDRTPIRASYIHSFWITENYLIIPEAPLYYKDKGLNALLHGSVISAMKWDGDEPTYFHVISRYPTAQKGLVTSIPFTGFFQFHTANAFEKVDTNGHTIITMDCASFSNGNILYQIHDFGLPREKCATSSEKHGTYFNGIAMPPSKQDSFADLCRYKLNLDMNRIDEKIVMAENIEFLRFNQDYMMEEYTYVYGCELKTGSGTSYGSTGIIKINVKNNTSIGYHDDGYLCSEPIFVKRPDGKLEDDGVLLVLANGDKCCYLVILDAADLKEISRFEIGAFTTTTFHGSYVDHEFKSVNVN